MHLCQSQVFPNQTAGVLSCRSWRMKGRWLQHQISTPVRTRQFWRRPLKSKVTDGLYRLLWNMLNHASAICWDFVQPRQTSNPATFTVERSAHQHGVLELQTHLVFDRRRNHFGVSWTPFCCHTVSFLTGDGYTCTVTLCNFSSSSGH